MFGIKCYHSAYKVNENLNSRKKGNIRGRDKFVIKYDRKKKISRITYRESWAE